MNKQNLIYRYDQLYSFSWNKQSLHYNFSFKEEKIIFSTMGDRDIPSVPVTTLAGLTSTSDCKYLLINATNAIVINKYTFSISLI